MKEARPLPNLRRNFKPLKYEARAISKALSKLRLKNVQAFSRAAKRRHNYG